MDAVLSAERKKIIRKRRIKSFLVATAFIGPAFVCFAFFKYYTSLQSLYYSFFNYQFNNPPGKFIWFDNYIALFKNPSFYNQLKNTAVLFIFGMAFGFWVPIVQALLLNELGKGKGVYRYLYLIPAGIPSIAMLAVMKYFWDPTGGLANVITDALGLGTHLWLLDEGLVKFSLRFFGIMGGGVGMLIYFVAINNISESLYEAARIDGASRTQSMFRITLPNMKNIISIQFLLALSGSLLAFDDIFVLTQGGPNRASESIVMGIYNNVYTNSAYGIDRKSVV